MIVGENGQPQSPMDAKSPSGPPPPAPHPTGRAPPSYQQSYQALHQSYHPQQPYTPLQPQRPTESAGRRFFKALVVGLAIWALLGMLTGSVVDLGTGHHRHGGSWAVPGVQESSGRLPVKLRAGPEAGDGTSSKCIHGYDWVRDDSHPPVSRPYGKWEVETEFTLPADADNLYLLSRGVSSVGSVEVHSSDADGDEVKVHVKALYEWQSIIDEAEVCLLKREKNEHGVGIFTPIRWEYPDSDKYKHPIHWSVAITLPAHVNYKKFTTRLHNFVQRLGDLKGVADFKTIDLSSSNAPIFVESIKADDLIFQTSNGPIKAGTLLAHSAHLKTSNSPISGEHFTGAQLLDLHTSNGPISGSFNTSSTLVLHTSNSPIKADVYVSNADGGHASSAELKTSNSGINAALTLASTAKGSEGGAFELSTTTSNGKLDVSLPSAPVDSKISLHARTSNAPAVVALPAAFEGRFSAGTSILGVRVHVGDDQRDPAGRGRKRNVEFSLGRNKKELSGKAYWEKGGEERGSVDVKTSTGSVELRFP